LGFKRKFKKNEKKNILCKTMYECNMKKSVIIQIIIIILFSKSKLEIIVRRKDVNTFHVYYLIKIYLGFK